jgi:GAF domain-containing protein
MKGRLRNPRTRYRALRSPRLRYPRLFRLALRGSIMAMLLGLALVPGLGAAFRWGREPAQRLSHQAWAAPNSQVPDAGQSRNVLLLHSYHAGLSWTESIEAAVRSVLLDPAQNRLAGQTELYVEYMDSKRVAMNEATEARWRTYLEGKYAAIPLDVIVVSDNDAYDFLRQAAGDLFPETPVVFCGINFFKDVDLAREDVNGVPLTERFTGVVETVDFLSTIQVALRLHPDVNRIIIVNDMTTTGILVQQELEAILPAFPNTTFEHLINPTLTDLGGLRALPGDTLVLLVLLNRDGDGRFYTYEQSIEMLLLQTNRPIYGVWEFYLGHGLVGGMLTNARLQGVTAGAMAAQLLNGAQVGDLPIVRESPNRYMFDYEQLRRFDIPLSSLPDARQTAGLAETLILGRPVPFPQRYGSAIVVSLGLLALAGVVLLLQRNNVQKQRGARVALEAANAALAKAHISMEAQVAARTDDLERRSRQFRIAAAVAREVVSGALAEQDDGADAEGVGSLLERVAALISEAFGFYHAGVFLVDELREYAVLRAASSPGGQAMVAAGHRLRIGGPDGGGGQGIVGYVAGTGESRIALDVGRDDVWRRTPQLSATRSEMALPLRIRGVGGDATRSWIIGVLDVQSQERGAFRQDDVEVLEIVADQLALAIQTSRLFEDSRRIVARLEEAYGERVRAPWYRARIARAYGFDGVAVRRLAGSTNADGAVRDAASEELDEGHGAQLEVPIPLRGEVVGTIVLRRDAEDRPWLPEERALAEAIAVQAGLSLEGAQLLDESRLQAQRQEMLGDITSRVRETLDVDMILRTALREMGQRLGIAGIEVRMRGGSSD